MLTKIIIGVAIFFLGIAVVLLFQNKVLNPNEIKVNTNHAAVIKQIQELKRLETAQFTIEKVIEAGTDTNAFQDYLFGDRILLIAHGEVIAGIDMGKLKDQDIEINNKSITLKLPPPEVLITSLDNQKTTVYDRKLGVLSKGNKDLEAEARAEAEMSIRQAACEGGILQQASDNARKQLTVLLQALNFEQVHVQIPSASC